jgi:Flp pilus assembly protein TadG
MSNIFQQISQRARATRIQGLVHQVFGETRGSALIELAVISSVFILLIAGAADFGRVEYYSIEASNAARAGVAYAAQGISYSTNTSAIQTAAKNDAPNLTNVATMTVSSNLICQCDNSGVFTTIGTTASACAAASASCLSPSRVINYVQVNTSAPVSTIFTYPAIPSSITVKGQATMRVQ